MRRRGSSGSINGLPINTAPLSPRFFATPAAWRAWLADHHAEASELWVGFYKKATGKPSITWPEAVDQALCYGWIDGVRRGLGPDAYAIRFTPRQARSTWSAVNVRRAKELVAAGLVAPAGLLAIDARADARTAIYSYEQRRAAALGADQVLQFKAVPKAWAFFESQPPSYRRTAAHWVTSAKRAETRKRRLLTLIEDSAAGLRVKPLRAP